MGNSLRASALTGTDCKTWPAQGSLCLPVSDCRLSALWQLLDLRPIVGASVLTQTTANRVSRPVDLVTHTMHHLWDQAPTWSHVQAGNRGKVRPAQVRCFDTARIHVQAGAGGRGSVAFRREANVPRGMSFWT